MTSHKPLRINYTPPAPLAERLRARHALTGMRITSILSQLIADHLPPADTPAPATPAPADALTATPAPKKPKATPITAARIRDVVELWRAVCVPAGCADIRTDADGNPAAGVGDAIKAAIKREGKGRDWADLFAVVAAAPFLTGQKTDWRASLSWVCKKSSMAKIDGGEYASGTAPQGFQNSSTKPRDWDFGGDR